MKKLLSVLLFSVACSSFGQIIKGDMNGDGELNISDVTTTVNTLLGKQAVEYISTDHDPYLVRNKDIVGKWYINKTETVTFNENGTTDYIGAAKFEYLPYQGCVLFYDKSNECIAAYKILKATSSSILWSKVELSSSYITSSVPVYKVKSITLDKASIVIAPDATVRLTTDIFPNNADNTNVTWKSSNTDCAMVMNGLVVGVATGTATITCTAADGSGVKATCTVQVMNKPVTKITLSTKSDTIMIGKYVKYKATISPSTADNKTLVWTSSDKSVATVASDGTVTAKGPGNATITAKANGATNVTASLNIFVPYSIDGHIYVDLGLPSGTLWAATNIGANSPEESGEYYAWGETSPKEYYWWNSYKFIMEDHENDSYPNYYINKYQIEDYYGDYYLWYTNGVFVGDGKSTLELSDDAAYVNWGKNWRIPSTAEFKELFAKCYWVKTSNYKGTGVAGYIIYKY